MTDEDKNHTYDSKSTQSEQPSEKSAEPQGPRFRVPPVTAIAGVLISDWAHGKLGNTVTRPSSNLQDSECNATNITRDDGV